VEDSVVRTSQDAVTGAFGYTGRAIAELLLASGREVVTLTRRSGAGDPLDGRVRVAPFLPADRPATVRSLEGVDTLYNTYWIRFPRGDDTYEAAVARSTELVAAAREAGVRRLVHVSVIRASTDGPTPYVRAKAALEAVIRTSGLDWSIVRPTLLFGRDDILLNNLAWALRRLPVYGIPGRGRYRLQPIHVEDVARICVEAATGEPGRTLDAAGPEQLEYRDLVGQIRATVRSRSLVVPMPAEAVLLAARLLGVLVRDVVLRRDEVVELTSSFLTSDEPPLGTTRVEDWLQAHAGSLGRRWSSELARNYPTQGVA
jgi:NADH dehydrogenase